MPRTYRNEFGAEYHDIPAPFLNRAEFTDTSWHNDACPSFEHNVTKVTVFIDAIDPDQRDNEGIARFVAIPAFLDVDGDVVGSDDKRAFSTETDVDAVLAFIEEER